MNIFKRSIHKILLIIMGSLISLTISGCDKTESTPVSSSSSQQIQDVQSQPVQNNAQPTKDEQTTEATDDSMPAETVPDETTEIQQDAQTAKPSDAVKIVEFNEYKVTGTRILKSEIDVHNSLPMEVELKVRCAVDNPEQCECIDGEFGGHLDQQGYPDNRSYIINCDKEINEVFNIPKHGTVTSFDKLLKHIKLSPERHQYAISFIFKDNLRTNTEEIRKLCPVQDGIVGEKCECFSAESHDPNSLLLTNGRLIIQCPPSNNENNQAEHTSETPKESVPDETTEIQQDNPQSKELDWNNPEHLNTIAAETQKAYNELISLAPEFASCYRKAQKVCTDKGIRPFGTLGMNQLSYNLEYDEFGNIYYIEDSFAKIVKKWERCETTYASCFRKKLPKSFNFDLSEIVKNYPNNVQRFGRIKLVFNITTNKVSIIDAYSKPIGTVHQNNVNSFGESYNKHYERWLKRREK